MSYMRSLIIFFKCSSFTAFLFNEKNEISDFKLPKNRKTSGFMLSEKKRFVFYSIYAWGLSLLMTLFTVMMDYIPGVSDMYKPKMALPQKMCYISRT